MGAAAARDFAENLGALLAEKAVVRSVFAAAPSQNEFLEHLVAQPGVDWRRVEAFHMDEYLGLPPEAPQRFGHFLAERLFNRVPLREIHYLDPGEDPALSARAYAEHLAKAAVDLVALGIGENGHLAFNDPPVADFDDPLWVKTVELDEDCRQQQVNDGCFPSIGSVPTHALTLTIPALLAGRFLFCMVPGPTKTAAVRAALKGPISSSCPASILRTHPRATLYLDEAAAAGVI